MRIKSNNLLKTASKSQLFIAVSLAFFATTSQAEFTTYSDIYTLNNNENIYTTGVQANSSNSAGLTGFTGKESLTFDFRDNDPKSNAIVHVAQNIGSFTLSNFSKIYFENNALDNGADTGIPAVANYWGPNSITIRDVGQLSFGTENKIFNGDAIQAIGGPINVSVDNLYINANGNGLYLQENSNNIGATNGFLTVEANNSAIIHGYWGAIYLESKEQGSTSNPTLFLHAKTIELSSDGSHAVALQDRQGGGSTGSSSIRIQADENISIKSKFDAVNITSQLNNTSPAEGSKTIEIKTNNGNVTLEAGRYGISIGKTGSGEISKVVDISGKTVSVTGTKQSIKADSNATLSFAAEKVELNGDATVYTNSSLHFAGQDENSSSYVKLSGNLNADEGTVDLQKTTFDLTDGSSMDVQTLTGSESSIILNNLANQNVKIGSNQIASLALVASGAANDRYANASEAAAALANATRHVTNGASGTYTFTGKEGAVSNGWTATVDDEGNATVTSISENASMAAVADFNAMTLAQWRGEINHLSQRLGDLRGHSSDIGAWARIYGYDAALSDTVDVDLKSNSIQVGADARINNNWIIGGAFSYTDQDADFSNGSGSSDGYSLAAYATGYFDCGGYIDVIGRIGRLSSDVIATSLGGSTFAGSYDNTTFGLSIETGYRWNITDTFYAEPQAELAYGFVKGDDFSSSANSVRIEQDDFQTLVGRLGVRTGANFSDNKGSIYLQASVNHDFLGDSDATATPAGGASRDINGDLGGTWFSYGVGLQYAADNGFNIYTSLERANGNEYQENYRYNVGIRYNF